MTFFTYPLRVRRGEPSQVRATDGAMAVANAGRIPFHLIRRVSVGMTGLGPGVTTIPLFIAPAGSRPFDCVVDIVTAFSGATANTNVQVGTAAATGTMLASVTINTAGRRDVVETATMVSVNDTVFTVDTTIQAIVSIETSAISAGEMIITGIFR